MGGKCSHSRKESGNCDLSTLGSACVIKADTAVLEQSQDCGSSAGTVPAHIPSPSPTNTICTQPHVASCVRVAPCEFDYGAFVWKNSMVEVKPEQTYPTKGGLKYQLGRPVGEQLPVLTEAALSVCQEAMAPEPRVNGVLVERIDLTIAGDTSLSP